MMKLNKLGTARRSASVVFVCLFGLLLSEVALARPWIVLVQNELTCFELADKYLENPFDIVFFPEPFTKRQATDYFTKPSRKPIQDRFVYLTDLAALAYTADTANDQILRDVFLTRIEQRAAMMVQEAPLFATHIIRCARAKRLSAALSREDISAVKIHADLLLKTYSSETPELRFEDLPLMVALREVTLLADSELITRFVDVMKARAARYEAEDPYRAGRLMSEMATALVAIGEYDEAMAMANRSSTMVPAADASAAAWQAFPVIYDVITAQKNREEAARIALALLNAIPLPAQFDDVVTEFNVYWRLAETADIAGDLESWRSLMSTANTALLNANRHRPSIPAFKKGLDITINWSMEETYTMIRLDPNHAEDTYQQYRVSNESLFRQAEKLFAPDARDRLLLAEKIDRRLNMMTHLHAALPGHRYELEDTAFRMAQLRTFNRITLANVAAVARHEKLSKRAEKNISRFLAMQSRFSLGLKNALARLQNGPWEHAVRDGRANNIFMLLDITYEETTASFEKFIQSVRRDAPRLASFVTVNPMSLKQTQSFLQRGEVLVSTLSTGNELFVWAISPSQTMVRKVDMPRAEVIALVKRLRESLSAKVSGGIVQVRPFDAQAAYMLYTATFAQVEDVLKGAEHVFWYGHGALSSIPPGVLISSEPPKPMVEGSGALSRLDWMIDRFPMSVLADLSLLRLYRSGKDQSPGSKQFSGVGAPLLSEDELEGRRSARSFDLAGAIDQTELAQMPKLPDAAEELKLLSELFPNEESLLLLGPAATEAAINENVLANTRIIALATHGFVTGEIAGLSEPALLMALPEKAEGQNDGLLTATEIASLDLNADLAILSACNTAAADGRPNAETFTGLSQSFVYAGARSILVSHWPVASGAAADISVGVVEKSKTDNLSLAESHRQTIVSLRENADGDDMRAHPFYWAPFVIVGDGAKSLR